MLSHIEPHPKCPLDSRRIIASATRLSSNRTAYFTSARKAATWAADHASRFQDQFLGSWTRQKWVIKLLDRTTILIHAEVCSFLAVFRWFHVGATPANMISPQGCPKISEPLDIYLVKKNVKMPQIACNLASSTKRPAASSSDKLRGTKS